VFCVLSSSDLKYYVAALLSCKDRTKTISNRKRARRVILGRGVIKMFLFLLLIYIRFWE